MKKKWFSRCLSFFILLSVFLTSSLWAGQVVTKEERLWAKKALREEKDLKALSAPNTLAVLYFQNKTEQKALNPLQKGLTFMLITDLSQVKGIQVVERVKLQALLEEMDLVGSDLVESNTAPRVGKLLGAQRLIGGDLMEKQPHSLQIKSLFLDVPTGKILARPISEGSLKEMFQMEKSLLFDIIKSLKIELRPEKEKELRKPFSTNMKAVMALFKGIEAGDRGQYKKAAQFYEKASREDPKIHFAQESLKELKDLGLIPMAKRSRQMLQLLKNRTSHTDQFTTEDLLKRGKVYDFSTREEANGQIEIDHFNEFPSPEYPY